MGSEDRLVGGRYRLRERLGSGGMGTVWRADDVVLGRQVAVKEVVFPPGTGEAEAEVLRERTRREARSAARLDHPSAVTVYDVVEEDGRPWLVLELVEARTLAQAVTEDGPLPPDEVARIGLAVLGALEAAHARGIVHRDVKPSNVLLRDDGRVVLTDFGIATTTGDSSLTHTGLLLGSPAYIAPERIRGETPGAPSDLWSLGATLFTAVEGRPPFDSGDALLTVTAVVTGEHAPYVSAGPLVPGPRRPAREGPGRAPAGRRRPVDAPGRGRPRAGDAAPRRCRPPGLAAAGLAGAAAAGAPAARTSALDLGEVRQELADARPEPQSEPRPEPRPAPTRVAAPAPRPRRLRRRPAAAPAGCCRRRCWPSCSCSAAGCTPPPAATTPRAPRRRPRRRPPRRRPRRRGRPATSAPATRAPTTAAPTTAAPTTPAPTTPAPTTPAPATSPPDDDAPAGFRTYEGAAGWTLRTPVRRAGWRSPCPPATPRAAAASTAIRDRPHPARRDRPGPARRRRRPAGGREGFRPRHPSYEEIGIRSVDYRGYEAADWEFTYEGLHVIDRVFVVDGTGHSLYFQTRAGDFADARSDFDGIAENFQAVGE